MTTTKIAILCNYELLPERVGGMDYFFWEFDKKCKENNIDVDWFFPNISQHGNYSDLTIYSSTEQSIENSFLTFLKQNKPKYTHVISHFLELCTPFFAKIKKESNFQTIAVDHNPRPLHGYCLKKRINKKLKGIFFSKYIDVFVGVSNYTANEILRDFGTQLKSKTITIYNGVIVENIVKREKRNFKNPTFLVASHLRESKGIQDLIQAVFLLSQTIKKEIVIDIYGDGPYRKQLENLVASLSLDSCFNFKGSVSDLKSVFCEYDYLLQPSHMECFSLSILESLAANVPVITTAVGGNTEVIIDGVNGYIVPPKKKEALSDVIQSVFLGDKKIEIDTRQLIENYFSLKKMVENHWELIRQ